MTFQGQFFSFAEMYIMPKPLQQPHPPIWIGGASPALCRAASVRAGLATDPDVGGSVASGASLSARGLYEDRTSGGADHPYELVNFPDITGSAARSSTPAAERPVGQGTPAQVAEDMRRLHEADLEAFQINFNGCHNRDQLCPL